MEQEAHLQSLIQEIIQRVRHQRAKFYGLRGCFHGTVFALFPLLLKGALGLAAPHTALGFLLIGTAGGALYGWFRRVTPYEAARVADRAFDLKDRLPTALEWTRRPDRTPLVALLVEDIWARFPVLDMRRAVPRHLPSEAKFLPLPVVLILVLLLMPPIPLPSANFPSSSPTTQARAPEEGARSFKAEERLQEVKKSDLERAGMMERDLTERRDSEGSRASGDLSPLFKDTSLRNEHQDFASFLRRGDERLKMLEQVDRLPDLSQDFTQSQYRRALRQMKQLMEARRRAQLSLQKLRDLLEEMERMGRKSSDWSGDVLEGLDALEEGETEHALQATERALAKMGAIENRDRSRHSLKGGREPDRQRSGGQSPGGNEDHDDSDMGNNRGSLAGKGKSPSTKGGATARIRAKPYDTRVESNARSGRKGGFEADFLGRGAHLPSELPYLSTYSLYRKMMEEALAQEEVPRGYRKQVKEYFQSLEAR
jgi:hypothetical protein